MCGFLSFEIEKHNRSGELGIWISPDYLRKGIALQCTKKIIDIGFEEYQLNRIGACTAVENYKCIKGLEKLGFTKEGIKREGIYVNGKSQDLICYSLLKREWVDHESKT